MDDNQTIVDDDLQKAIDDITKTTDTDPVFSNPVAAPSPVPENEVNNFNAPATPYVEEEAKVEMVTPSAEPIAPLDPIDVPELNPTPNDEPLDQEVEEAKAEEEKISAEEPVTTTTDDANDTQKIKEAILRDLAPLLNHVNDLDSSQKFKIYRNVLESLQDYTILQQAYDTAREIEDEAERAEAYLFLINTIDKM